MYMNTRANLDYWSTDNCCLRWSLRTGAIVIGFFSLVWQALMVMTGVMMLVKCPVNTTATITTTNTTSITLTLLNDTLTDEIALDISKPGDDSEEGDKGVKCLQGSGTGVGGTGDEKQTLASGNVDAAEGNNSTSSNSSRIENLDGNSTAITNDKMFLIECPWLPDPETEVLGVYSKEKLFLVAGIFIAYSGVYFILSFCVLVGVFTSSVTLLQGWVAFTGFHNLLILATLLVPLPFTTLTHLFLSIAYFILSLYTWAVVKSYMHALKVELNKPLLPEGSITDYTVDGVDVTEIPVQV